MLAVFHKVLQQLKMSKIGTIVTFDQMFEGIRAGLKSSIQHSMSQAENNLYSEFAIKVLKAIFLVKDIKGFKVTRENISVLLTDNFNLDINQLKERTKLELQILEDQIYIRRNAEEYEYITDEERDIEREIRNTDVEKSEVLRELKKLIFDDIIKLRKISCDENKIGFPYSKTLDGIPIGRAKDMTLYIISPLGGSKYREQDLVLQNINNSVLLVFIPQDDDFIRDIYTYMKTDKYYRENISQGDHQNKILLLNRRHEQNQKLHKALRERLKIILGKANIYAGDIEIKSSASDINSRIDLGFKELIYKTYPSLKMLEGKVYTDDDIQEILRSSSNPPLLSDDIDSPLFEAEQEMFNFIVNNEGNGVQTKLSDHARHFEKKPYGWPLNAVLFNLAKLILKNRLELMWQSELLDRKDIWEAFKNTREYDQILIETIPDIPHSVKQEIYAFYDSFFESPPSGNDAINLAQETGKAMIQLSVELNQLTQQASKYPFNEIFVYACKKLEDLSKKPYTWYLSDLNSKKDEFIKLKIDIIDPIRVFLNGPKEQIFKNVRIFMIQNDDNFSYVDSLAAFKIKEALSDPFCFSGNMMQEIKNLQGHLEDKIKKRIVCEKGIANEKVKNMELCISKTMEFNSLSYEERELIIQRFKKVYSTIETKTLISSIRDFVKSFEKVEYRNILKELRYRSQEASIRGHADQTKVPMTGEENDRVDHQINFISISDLAPSFEKVWLENGSDVDKYLEELRRLLMEMIDKGELIQL
jgi:hypothetical protein